MATFHPFTRLPFEIRTRIWEITVEPRTVEIGFKREKKTWGAILHATSSTPVPAILHVCYEARNLGLYERAFSFGFEPRHLWVNFEMDMISIGRADFKIIRAERINIRRLKFEGGDSRDFFHIQSKGLQEFSLLEDLDIVCQPGDTLSWQPAWKYLQWPCPKKNIRFIDPESGQVVDGYELDMKMNVLETMGLTGES